MATLNRKEFLGGLGCTAAGTLAGAYLPRLFSSDLDIQPAPPPKPFPRVVKPAPPHIPLHGGEESFSQCGEDVNIHFIFRYFSMFGGGPITYMDVGAHDPTEINNTYFFYQKGYRGVLVEPNGFYCDLLRKVRPEDTTLEAGIGISDAKEADYYLLNESALNTFSKEQADRLVAETKGRVQIKEVRKIPFLNINEVMETHFKGAPSFLSIDTEGLDLAILKTMDFTRYRPKVLCVETLITNTTKTNPEIAAYLTTQNYTQRAGSLVNAIFVDNKYLT